MLKYKTRKVSPSLQRRAAGVPPLLHPPPPTAEHDAGLPGEPADVGSDAAVGGRIPSLAAHLRPLPRQRRYAPKTLPEDGRCRGALSTLVCVFPPPGSENRLRELCKELLGPVHKSAATAWEPSTLVEKLVPPTQPLVSLDLKH